MDWRRSEKGIFLSRIFDLKRRREFDAIEGELHTALERYPDEVQFQALLAENHWNQGRRGQAEAMVREISARAQGLADFHSLSATIALARQRHEAALESYRTAHALRPTPFYLKRQADCLLHLKRFDEAWGILRPLVDENDRYTLLAAAKAMEGMGRPAEAERFYRRILEIAPRDAVARTRLLKLSVAAEEPETAQREVDRMLRVPSRRNDAALLRVKADQLREANRHREAAEVYQTLAETSSGGDREFFRRQLAFCRYKAGMDEQAYPLLLELVGERPRDTYLRSTLIALARRAGKMTEVADFYAGLARRDPANAHLFGVVKRIRRELSTAR